MDTILQDLRYAWRAARHRPGFTAAALVTLALGVGATTAIFSVVQAVLLRPLPYADAARIVVFGQVSPESEPDDISTVSHLNFIDWRDQSTRFESMALFSRALGTVTGMGEAQSVPGAQVTRDFFDVFDAAPFMGRTFSEDETRPDGPLAIIISHAFWQERLGGATDVLQRTLEIGGRPRPIVGVTPEGFEYPAGARLYFPVRNDDASCGRGCVYLLGIGRLRPDVTVDAANLELAGIAQRLEQQYPDANTDVSARVRSLVDYTVGDVRQALYILMAAGIMVLLIACANVANLLLVRGAARHGELAVRSVLGAGRRRILTQLMTENVMLALLGGALGVVLASWGVDLLRAVAPADLPRMDAVRLDRTALLFAIAIVVLTAVLFGLLPAMRLSRGALAQTLRGSGRGDLGVRQGWGRFGILVTEVALAVMLLFGAGLLIRSLARVSDVDPGYDFAGVAHFSIGLSGSYETPEQAVLFFEQLRERIAALPGVEQAGLVMPMPLSPTVYGTSFERMDVAAEVGDEPGALLRTVDGNAFATLGISLIRGRGFEATDRHGTQPVALINQTAADEYWPGEDPIGKQIEVGVGLGFDESPRTIIGIVADIRAISITEEPEPEVLVPYAQSGSSFATIVMKGPDPGRLLEGARAEVSAMDPNLPLIRPGPALELIEAQTAATRFYLLLLGVFAVLAVTLAAIGIYGVVAFIVTGRRREIGVRLALGARIQQVVALVVWQGVRPALVGLLLGIGGAIAAGRVASQLLFDVEPHDPLTFAGVTALLLAIVVLACLVPAGRASRIPPASALRSE